ncbi:hypothetical protein N7539_008952 [Penicillium diatomitis]|uniref:Protein kinase domain-containing protein n=1 Tax=Penicillium diatomitis TaxID=2819901 RepID=A0A9W9WKT3_9EURO|nr:uncharacterized protein N7539_008952 [Penicillium diatomitis]KAJ5469334.1 hypothetical protein N7539_008952 [Penicillium diatomitis]
MVEYARPRKYLVPDRKLGDAVSFLEGDEREGFLDLAKGMLVWNPDTRKSAGELIVHPFLQPKQISARFLAAFAGGLTRTRG